MKTLKEVSKTALGDFNEYGNYGENNGPIDDWIKRTKDDPHDNCLPMSKPGDKDYEC